MEENFFLFPCCSRRGGSEPIKGEAELRLGGKNQLRPARLESVPGRRQQNCLSIHQKHFINSVLFVF
ncbi:MAG: hypothetical protein EA344_01945 [Alkalicoccus sp.]|nr:MAG: hypothetical protein EA344_01945 [Alkalicoccus sp.]